MPEYMLLLYAPEVDEAEEAERWAELPLWLEITESLKQAGVHIANAPLYPVGAATTVRVRGGEVEFTDGPFATTKEILAEYYLLDCPDLEVALQARLGCRRPAMGQSRSARLWTCRSCPERAAMAMTLDDVLAETFRRERASVLATLIRRVGDFQLAEDAVQDAFADALSSWGRDGVPANPGAWITVAARRRAIDRLRRNRSVADRAERLAELSRLDASEGAPEPMTDSPGAVVDDRLRLMFTCCHPALAVPAQVALTLRTLGGLTTAEIARAFLVAEPTLGKRIVRAKRKIADARIPYRVPANHELPQRLGGVLRVVYLIFNEGYAAAGGTELVRGSLCDDAIRLATLLSDLMPDAAEAWGLLSLILLHDARRAARVDASGAFVALDRQDTERWDADKLAAGRAALRRALRLGGVGEFKLQAAIAAIEVESALTGAIDWGRVAALYGALAAVAPSPVVAVNRAAAVTFAEGAKAGLALLAPLLRDPALARYQPLHATHAELLRRRGDAHGARDAYRRAIAVTDNAVERAELARRLGAVQTAGPAAT